MEIDLAYFKEVITTNMDMSHIGIFVITLLMIYITHWLYRWRNPKCNGVLPPGSMGIPFIGETLQLVIPSPSIDLPSFLKKRIKRYGKIFKTNIAGHPAIITSDPEFNYFLLRQDGKLVETWSMDTFAEVFDQASQSSKKYIRNLALNHFGVDALKGRLLIKIEDFANQTLNQWSNQESVEVKGAAIQMTIKFSALEMFSCELENASGNIGDMFKDLVEGLMSFPINLPGTSHHKCLKIHKNVRELMRDNLKKRLMKSEGNTKGDLLDHIIQDMNTETYLTEDFIVQLMFGLLFVSSDSISTTLALAFKFLAEHPLILEELIAEHDLILEKKENSNAPLTWSDYKSMTFTLQVINEVLRLGNIAPGFFRRALKDVPVNGYTIPKGWVIMIGTAALHLDSNHFEDPLSFNPSRWKDIQSNTVAKCFMPFGSGMKQCAGAEYSRVFLSTFLHVLVTKYRWAMVKGGKIVRAPIIRFPNGFHFKISEKSA